MHGPLIFMYFIIVLFFYVNILGEYCSFWMVDSVAKRQETWEERERV